MKLDPHQDYATQWLMRRTRGILGDDRGVGKTPPAIVAARTLYPNGYKLVLCPAYLLDTWKTKLRAWGAEDIVTLDSDPQRKKDLLREEHEWTVMSYALMTRPEYLNLLLKRRWDVWINDEAHRLRGRNSQRTRAAYRLEKQCDRIWHLTGTPIVADAGDLFPLLKLCSPGEFTSYWRFVETHCYIEWTPWGNKVGRLRDEKTFYELLRPWMLRRTLEEALPAVPPVVEEIITVDIGDRTRQEYRRAKQEYRIRQSNGEDKLLESGGALVNGLRQLVAADPAKIKAMSDLMEDLGKEPVVVYTWYRETARRATADLLRRGYIVRMVTGDDPPVTRARVAEDFNVGKYNVLVATIGSLNEGVDLQTSRYVVFLEEHWLDADNDQAVGRLQRRGQTRTVLKYVILARKTIDESVHNVAASRARQNLRSVVDAVMAEVDDVG